MFAADDAGDNFVVLDVELWHWAVLLAIIMALLLIDLLVVHKEAHEVHTKEAAIESAVWIGCGLAFSFVIWWWFGAPGHRRVHVGLPDREEPEHRQRLRVGVDHGLLRRSAEVPAPRVVLGHLRRSDHARDLHLRGRRRDRALRLGALRVRGVPALHGGQAGLHRQRPRRSEREQVPQAGRASS